MSCCKDKIITKITVENSFGTFTIERDGNFNLASDFIEGFFVPILSAMGFGDETIKDYINTTEL